jgi:hypothetical protein
MLRSLGEQQAQQKIDNLVRELARRKAARTSPVDYAETKFPYKYWQVQREIIESVFKNKYTTVKSCHTSGKTFLAASVVLLFMEAFVPSKAITTATSNTQVEKLLWAEINTQFNKATPPYSWVWRCLNKELKVAPDHFALGFSSDEEINFQGFHSPNFLLVADEASGIPTPVFDSLSTLLSSGNPHTLLISNPDSLTGYFYNSHSMSKYHKFTISAFDTPNLTAFDITMDDIRSGEWQEKIKGKEMPFPALVHPAWVAEKYDEWGEERPLFVAKIFGEFPKNAVDTLFPLSYIESAQKRKGSTHGKRQWGLDVARLGADSSILRYRRGERLEITQEFNQFDTEQLADWAFHMINKVDASAPVAVDAVGIGAGVADKLRRRKLNVFEYTGSGSSCDEDCYNQRSEFYWHLSNVFRKGKIHGHIDELTKEELSAMKYTIPNGKVRVMKKDQIKKEINRSPDRADALMLCYAPIDNMSAVDDIIIPGEDATKVKDNKQGVEHWYPA